MELQAVVRFFTSKPSHEVMLGDSAHQWKSQCYHFIGWSINKHLLAFNSICYCSCYSLKQALFTACSSVKTDWELFHKRSSQFSYFSPLWILFSLNKQVDCSPKSHLIFILCNYPDSWTFEPFHWSHWSWIINVWLNQLVLCFLLRRTTRRWSWGRWGPQRRPGWQPWWWWWRWWKPRQNGSSCWRLGLPIVSIEFYFFHFRFPFQLLN